MGWGNASLCAHFLVSQHTHTLGDVNKPLVGPRYERRVAFEAVELGEAACRQKRTDPVQDRLRSGHNLRVFLVSRLHLVLMVAAQPHPIGLPAMAVEVPDDSDRVVILRVQLAAFDGAARRLRVGPLEHVQMAAAGRLAVETPVPFERWLLLAHPLERLEVARARRLRLHPWSNIQC